MQNNVGLQKNQSVQTKKLVTIPLLAAIAFLLQYLEFPMPLLPNFLKLDFSTLPGLIGGLVFGPVAGVMVELIKNMLHFLLKSSDGLIVGEVANFMAGSSFIYVAVMIQRKFKSGNGFIAGLLLGTVLMTVLMSVANFYVIMPAYAAMYSVSMANLLEMFHLESLWSFILYGIAPFNVIKGLALSLVAYPIFMNMASRLRLTA